MSAFGGESVRPERLLLRVRVLGGLASRDDNWLLVGLLGPFRGLGLLDRGDRGGLLGGLGLLVRTVRGLLGGLFGEASPAEIAGVDDRSASDAV